MKNVGNSSRGRSQGVPKIFRAPMYRAHCAVIFAIAQLFCYTRILSHCTSACAEHVTQFGNLYLYASVATRIPAQEDLLYKKLKMRSFIIVHVLFNFIAIFVFK